MAAEGCSRPSRAGLPPTPPGCFLHCQPWTRQATRIRYLPTSPNPLATRRVLVVNFAMYASPGRCSCQCT